MKKVLFILMILCNLQAEIHDSIIDFTNKMDKKYNIDKKIILAYMLTESKAYPYAMLVKTNNGKIFSEILKEYGLEHKLKGKYLSIFPNTKTQAEFLYEFIGLYKDKLSIVDYDLGIMQINKKTIKNLKLNEKSVYLNVFLNIETGTSVMRACYDTLKNKTNIKNIIECYNRGTSIAWLNKSERIYLNNFLNNYKKIEKGDY